jgi:voltage-gated potassium channel
MHDSPVADEPADEGMMAVRVTKAMIRKLAGPLGKKKKARRSQLYVEPVMPPWWDWVIIALTTLTLVALAVEWYHVLPAHVSRYMQWGDNVVCLVFISEFLYRLRAAPRKLEFVRRNWIDLLGAVPMVDWLRSARLIRFIRLLRVMRFFLVWRRIARRYEIPMPKGVLSNLGLTTIGIWVASSLSFYRFEHGVNENIKTYLDAFWWSMTTLSTVGYGDLYPATDEGRVIAMLTMVLGIGLLGAVAATTATTFMELRQRGKKGLRSYVMRDHLLVLGWNDKGIRAINNFRDDPRHASTNILIVAERDETPYDDPDVRFIKGSPGKVSILRKASAEDAGAAIVLANNPENPRSDHESALVVTSLRRVNQDLRIGVEMVDADNREHLMYAGCDAIVDDGTTIANLLVRGIQDMGVSDVVTEILSSEFGSEIYRVDIPSSYVGKTWRDYAKDMIDDEVSAIAIARGTENLINPPPDTKILEDDEAFVISKDPPMV